MEDAVDCSLFLVQVLDDRLGVVLGRGSEDVDLVVLSHIFQKLQTMRPDIEPELIAPFNEPHIRRHRRIKHRVNESLIKIEHEELLFGHFQTHSVIEFGLWERYRFFPDVLVGWAFEVLHGVGQAVVQQVDELLVLLRFQVWSANIFCCWV